MLATIQPACHSERSEVEESALSSFPVILNEAKNPFLSCRPQAASLPTAMTGVRVLRLRSGRQNRTRFPAVILSEAKRSRRIRSFLLSRHSERSEESVPFQPPADGVIASGNDGSTGPSTSLRTTNWKALLFALRSAGIAGGKYGSFDFAQDDKNECDFPLSF